MLLLVDVYPRLQDVATDLEQRVTAEASEHRASREHLGMGVVVPSEEVFHFPAPDQGRGPLEVELVRVCERRDLLVVRDSGLGVARISFGIRLLESPGDHERRVTRIEDALPDGTEPLQALERSARRR